jgi:two-component system alkaline phosphatase synthesis response regulator PhoP
MNTKILLVDDEKDIVEFLKYNLVRENFEVITAFDGEEALKKLNLNPDLIILDVMMPKLNGFEVCKRIKEIKEFSKIPVIFLTAKSSEVDEVLGLELGANDYISKPISPQKLIARVKMNLRKVEYKVPTQKHKTIKYGPIWIDTERFIVKINGEEKIFPKKEFEILSFLVQNPGVVFSRESLLKNVWGSEIFVVERTVDVHIRKIREKLAEYEYLIETLKGIGYRLKND